MAPRKPKGQEKEGEKNAVSERKAYLAELTKDSVLAVNDSDDDSASPAGFNQTNGGTDLVPVDVMHVTPEKAKISDRSPSPIDDTTKTFYTIQKETFQHCKHESKESAVDFFEKAKLFNPNFSDTVILQCFDTEAAMLDFVNALKTMAGSSGLKRPPNPCITIQMGPSDGSSRNELVKGLEPIDNPYSATKAVVKRPKLGFATEKSSTVNDDQLRRFEEALKNSNTKLDVFHLVLEGSNFDVWGFSLMENEDHYWSWKPMVLEKAIITEMSMPIFEKEGMSMDEMLCHVRAANIRDVPGGPNVVSSFTLKSGKKMDKMILYGLVPSPSSELTVKETAAKFCAQMKNSRVQAAYRMAMESTMKADSIKKDVGDGGPLWEKLASAANNVRYHNIESLNQVLCDHTIEEIIRLTYGYSGGESPSMWDRRVFKLAYGDIANES